MDLTAWMDPHLPGARSLFAWMISRARECSDSSESHPYRPSFKSARLPGIVYRGLFQALLFFGDSLEFLAHFFEPVIQDELDLFGEGFASEFGGVEVTSHRNNAIGFRGIISAVDLVALISREHQELFALVRPILGNH